MKRELGYRVVLKGKLGGMKKRSKSIEEGSIQGMKRERYKGESMMKEGKVGIKI